MLPFFDHPTLFEPNLAKEISFYKIYDYLIDRYTLVDSAHTKRMYKTCLQYSNANHLQHHPIQSPSAAVLAKGLNEPTPFSTISQNSQDNN